MGAGPVEQEEGVPAAGLSERERQRAERAARQLERHARRDEERARADAEARGSGYRITAFTITNERVNAYARADEAVGVVKDRLCRAKGGAVDSELMQVVADGHPLDDDEPIGDGRADVHLTPLLAAKLLRRALDEENGGSIEGRLTAAVRGRRCHLSATMKKRHANGKHKHRRYYWLELVTTGDGLSVAVVWSKRNDGLDQW